MPTLLLERAPALGEGLEHEPRRGLGDAGAGARESTADGPDALISRRQPPPAMLDVPPVRLRSCAASGIHDTSAPAPASVDSRTLTGRADAHGRLTLDDLIASVWEGLAVRGAVSCPVCAGPMVCAHAGGAGEYESLAGTCLQCGSRLS